MLALQEAGFDVYVPFGENTRADLVFDDGVGLARVQCKTGRLRKGAVRFKCCSSYAHHSNPGSKARDYLGEIDFFGVHCPETQAAYLIPIEEIPLRWEGALRVEPALNNQRSAVRLAADYEIAQVAVRVRARPDATSDASGPSA